jgi:hypothetical protein
LAITRAFLKDCPSHQLTNIVDLEKYWKLSAGFLSLAARERSEKMSVELVLIFTR